MTFTAKALLFDMDGVLVDSEELMLESAIEALAEWGVHAVPSDFTDFIGSGEDKFVGGVALKHGVDYDTAMKDRAYEIYAERAPALGIVFPGVQETLQKIKQAGFKFGICSSADRVKVNVNIKAIGFTEDFFDFIVSGMDVVLKKPNPDIYLHAMKLLGLKPEDCIVVEDAVNGIIAAQRAGMRAIAVTSSFSKEELQDHLTPDAIIDDIRALPSLVSL